jgi:hypothetical protein
MKSYPLKIRAVGGQWILIHCRALSWHEKREVMKIAALFLFYQAAL